MRETSVDPSGLAGVRLLVDGREPRSAALLVVEANGLSLTPGAIVEVEIEGQTQLARLIVGPGSLLQAHPTAVRGRILSTPPERLRAAPELDPISILKAHPSSRFPRLGQEVELAQGPGEVVRLDVPRGLITLRLATGGETVISVDDLPT